MVRLSDALRMSKSDEDEDEDAVSIPEGEAPEKPLRQGYETGLDYAKAVVDWADSQGDDALKKPDQEFFEDNKDNKGKKWRFGMGRWWKSAREVVDENKSSVVKKRK